MNLRLRLCSLFAIAAASFSFPAHGTTFDWPTSPAFPAGPSTNGAKVVGNYSGLGAVTITNVGGGTWEAGYPVVDTGNTYNGDTSGGTSNTKGLQLLVASEPSTTAYMNVVITFGFKGGGVTNASLTIWDVDSASNFTDELKDVVGVTSTGALVPLNLAGSTDNTITNNNTTSATAIGTASSDNLDDTGNVTITSGTTPIQAIEFEYLDANATTRTTQIIGISPITFTALGTATPEAGSALGGLLLCGGVVGIGAVRRRKNPATA